MRNSCRANRVFLIVAFLGLLGAVACNSGSNSLSKAPQGGGNSGTLIGAGSTFVYPVMMRWIAGFQSSHPGVQINY